MSRPRAVLFDLDGVLYARHLLDFADVIRVTPDAGAGPAARAAGCAFLGYRMASERRVDNLSEVVDLVEAQTPR